MNQVILTHFSAIVDSKYKPAEIPGAQWIGNSTAPTASVAFMDYIGLRPQGRCCVFVMPFLRDDVRWAVYSEIRDGVRENGLHF